MLRLLARGRGDAVQPQVHSHLSVDVPGVAHVRCATPPRHGRQARGLLEQVAQLFLGERPFQRNQQPLRPPTHLQRGIAPQEAAQRGDGLFAQLLQGGDSLLARAENLAVEVLDVTLDGGHAGQ